jgi:hypothetical protein
MNVRTARHVLTRLLLPSALLGAVVLGACSEDEAAAPHDHTPASAKLFVNDVDVSANLLLEAGAVTRVEVRFYHDDGDEILGTELDHFAALNFTPGALATPVMVVDNHYAFDVTAQAGAAAGTVLVGWGHEAAADDLSFGPFPVTVAVP